MSDESENDELEHELRRLAARQDPVPPELVQAATEAFSWRNIDAELAELVFDSLLNTDQAALVRSSPGRRLVSFQTPELTIDVEVTATASGRDVMGQITPPAARCGGNPSPGRGGQHRRGRAGLLPVGIPAERPDEPAAASRRR